MGRPSTEEEVAAVVASSRMGHEVPYTHPACYDKAGRPWIFRRGKWKRTEDARDLRAEVVEQPQWVWGPD